jgi:hypothetical protein
MRRTLTVLSLLLVPTLAQAQQPAYQGYEPGEEGTKRVLTADAFNDAKKASDELNLDLTKSSESYQKDWDTVKDERELWLRRNQIYDNVISLRNKDKVQQYLDEQRKKLGVGEGQGYQRLGEYNPFDGRSYIRYYDDKTGELKISEVRGFRDDLERQRQDIETHRKRVADSEKLVNDKYNAAIVAYDKAETARQDWVKSERAEAERQAQAEAQRQAQAMEALRRARESQEAIQARQPRETESSYLESLRRSGANLTEDAIRAMGGNP